MDFFIKNISQFSNLEILAVIVLSFLLLLFINSILRGIWTCFLANLLGFGVKWRPGNDVWAVITGATNGIGLEYAKQLASMGYSLVIISRNEDKLNFTAEMLKKNNSKCKQVKIITVDFSRTDIYDKIENELNKLNTIDVLVNNVGTLNNYGNYFAKIPSTSNTIVFNVNMLSCTRMIELILPKMVEHKRGIIINISSLAGLRPQPMMGIYSATKAYVNFLSESVSVENESNGIIIQTVTPILVKTNLVNDMLDSFFIVTPEEFVSSAIKTVGVETLTYGHWKHKFQAYFLCYINFLFGHRFYMRFFKFINKQRKDSLIRHKKNSQIELSV